MLEQAGGDIITVGVAEWQVARSPGVIRTTLGSCVGVVLYASQFQAGGMAHILLGEPPPGKIIHRGKYARTAIEGLVNELGRLGVASTDLEAAIIGGASLFDGLDTPFLNRIGPGNIDAARAALPKMKINIKRAEVGGKSGRTISLYLDDGRIELRTGSETRTL